MESPNTPPVINEQDVSKTKILKDFTTTKDWKKNFPLILGALAVVLGGVLIGWFFSRGATNKSSIDGPKIEGVDVSQNEAGLEDTSAFSDTVEGKLVEGGIDGEGNYHLERDGGPSQNVYLTSTVIDLGSFVGKKVQIWGETISGKKAGWLMDVGKIKVIQ